MTSTCDGATTTGIDLPAGELLRGLGVTDGPVAADGTIEGIRRKRDRLLRE